MAIDVRMTPTSFLQGLNDKLLIDLILAVRNKSGSRFVPGGGSDKVTAPVSFEDAWQEFLRRFGGIIHNIIAAFDVPPGERENLKQSVLLSVFISLETYQEQGRLHGWVRTVAYNRCQDFKKRVRFASTSREQAAERLVQEVIREFQPEDYGVVSKILSAAFADITPLEAEALWLHKAQGLSVERIAMISNSNYVKIREALEHALSVVPRELEESDDLSKFESAGDASEEVQTL